MFQSLSIFRKLIYILTSKLQQNNLNIQKKKIILNKYSKENYQKEAHRFRIAEFHFRVYFSFCTLHIHDEFFPFEISNEKYFGKMKNTRKLQFTRRKKKEMKIHSFSKKNLQSNIEFSFKSVILAFLIRYFQLNILH